MYRGSAMTESMLEVDPEYMEDVLVVDVLEAFTDFHCLVLVQEMFWCITPYFSVVIMFVCALSFEVKDLHHLM
jgi:hypothetical protein